MTYSVDRIPGSIRIDPDAGGQEQQRKRERQLPKQEASDSVSISEEAKRRSAQQGAGEPEEPAG